MIRYGADPGIKATITPHANAEFGPYAPPSRSFCDSSFQHEVRWRWPEPMKSLTARTKSPDFLHIIYRCHLASSNSHARHSLYHIPDYRSRVCFVSTISTQVILVAENLQTHRYRNILRDIAGQCKEQETTNFEVNLISDCCEGCPSKRIVGSLLSAVESKNLRSEGYKSINQM